LLSNKALALDPEKEKEKYTAYIKEALSYLEKASAANPKDTDLKNLYAYTLYLDGNYEKSVIAMEEMYKADPKGTSSGIVSAIYDCYSHLKNKAKMDEYEKILEERYK
jgi:lipopolysaccharide biosynthesis regulator YciM